MENEQLYNSFIAEVNRNIFLSIGESMESEIDKYKEDVNYIKTNIRIKSYDEILHEYSTKLDHKIDNLLYKQEQICEKINILTLENNLTLENMKIIKAKLQNNGSSIVNMITNYFTKEDLERQYNEETNQYCNVFDKITQLHEEVLEIDEEIKNTKGFK